jgi:hypothetical protein
MSILAVAGCPATPEVPRQPTGGLRLMVEPADARIYVDEKLEGDATTYAQRPLLLHPGHHRIKIMADGYYSEYIEVEVGEMLIDLTVSLTPVPEPLGIEIE